MSTSDSSYYQLHTALREQTDIDSVFQRSLDELSGKVDFSWVKSCVSLGTGYGAQELLFVKRFLPNLQTFIAVEPDHESVNALRAGFQALFTVSLFNSFLCHLFRQLRCLTV